MNVEKLGNVLDDYIRGPFGSALKRSELKNQGIPVYEQQQAIEGTRNFRYFIDQQKYNELKRFTVKPGDVLVSCSGTIGKTTVIRENDELGIISQALLILRPDQNKILPDYLRYFLESRAGQYAISSRSAGSVQVNIAPRKVIENVEFSVPKLNVQCEILDTLSTVDEKIALNNALLTKLEQYCLLIFHKWFVDFNFPNEDGLPYKENGGVMHVVDGKCLPLGWAPSNVGSIAVNFDSQRVPLSDSNRARRQGRYPYYGATQIMDYIDDFIFDGVFCLIAEDGSVIDASNRPIVQLAWNKFWVNNHAHVLQGSKDISTEYLYLSLKSTNVMRAVTGAIQKKINQQNLNKLPALIPDKATLLKFDSVIKPIFEKIMILSDETSLLLQLRDLFIRTLIA